MLIVTQTNFYHLHLALERLMKAARRQQERMLRRLTKIPMQKKKTALGILDVPKKNSTADDVAKMLRVSPKKMILSKYACVLFS